MKKRHWAAVAVGLVAVGLGGLMVVDGDPAGMLSAAVQGHTAALKPYEGLALTPESQGALNFTFGDFGSLSSEALDQSATPWKLTTALLALKAANGDLAQVTPEAVTAIFRNFGFVTPQRIANWPSGLPEPSFTGPLGQNVGFAGRLLPPIGATIGNSACSGCHASVVYDANGQPDTSAVWLGTPNGSINLERYVTALYAALRDRPADESQIWAAVEKLYPQTDWREWLVLRSVALPRVKAVVEKQESTIGRLLPFEVSTMGATNGLQALQARMGVIPSDHMAPINVPISVPELGGRIWRSSLLAGGSYTMPGEEPQRVMRREDITPEHLHALAGITAFFTVPSMGVSPATAAKHVGDAERIMDWLVTYRPQPFPGAVDAVLAEEGSKVYAARCASCHGSYVGTDLVEFPNWRGDMGTDRAYLDAFDQYSVDVVNSLGYGALLDGHLSDAYVAQPLTGLWSSAPYLHNGSVPTLWHLMHPAQRPKQFDVGGHAMDFEKVGIAGVEQGGNWVTPPGYTPWAEPVRIDTSVPGLTAAGHDAPFDVMSETEKTALLEFLKLI